ncbi:MAG: CRP/FNR family cyclic AMP-dependent transcriptional regulator [Candidatus Azotimanducaceae bacterium]|jgi:CRP/FNR family cyclic AMP-dependent transcriptional regulator
MQTVEEYRVGETILQQGSESTGFYLLEKGAVEVFKNEIMLNVLIYPGTIFGEIGDILGNPRTCTIKARAETRVVKYDYSDLETLVAEHPEIVVKIMHTLANRLDRTTQKLAELSNTSTFCAEDAK